MSQTLDSRHLSPFHLQHSPHLISVFSSQASGHLLLNFVLAELYVISLLYTFNTVNKYRKNVLSGDRITSSDSRGHPCPSFPRRAPKRPRSAPCAPSSPTPRLCAPRCSRARLRSCAARNSAHLRTRSGSSIQHSPPTNSFNISPPPSFPLPP
ncbi:hypothetical protein B0H14DRAFT_954168 [Mycena olivaceomarginata]|nr:hypothetical protein B0H14DRAFT_954168 [Mycena olivaceomarginata]